MPPELILYFREGCHLCEDMEHLLGELLEPGSFRLTRVDIDENVKLREAYDIRVPVLSLVRLSAAGTTAADPPARRAIGTRPDDPSDHEMELCEHFLDLEAVTDALASYNRQFLAACSSPAT